MTKSKQGKDKRSLFFPRTRCNAEELALLEQKAFALGLTKSDLLRSLVRQDVQVKEVPCDPAMLAELKRIGRELQTLKDHSNSEGIDRTIGTLEKILEAVLPQ